VLIKGTLDIDVERGVIYFHDESGMTLVRIYGLNRPVPDPRDRDGLDITFGSGMSWQGQPKEAKA
jgi:hypothetical protein